MSKHTQEQIEKYCGHYIDMCGGDVAKGKALCIQHYKAMETADPIEAKSFSRSLKKVVGYKPEKYGENRAAKAAKKVVPTVVAAPVVTEEVAEKPKRVRKSKATMVTPIVIPETVIVPVVAEKPKAVRKSRAKPKVEAAIVPPAAEPVLIVHKDVKVPEELKIKARKGKEVVPESDSSDSE